MLESEGLVVISRERIAASRSATAPEAPCMGVPPVIDTLVLGALFFEEEGPGVEEREVGFDVGLGFGARRSEIREPAAEGGVLLDFWLGGVDIFGVDVLEGCVLFDALAALRPIMYSLSV